MNTCRGRQLSSMSSASRVARVERVERVEQLRPAWTMVVCRCRMPKTVLLPQDRVVDDVHGTCCLQLMPLAQDLRATMIGAGGRVYVTVRGSGRYVGRTRLRDRVCHISLSESQCMHHNPL